MTRLILRILVKVQNNEFNNNETSNIIYGHKRTWNCLMDRKFYILNEFF